MFVLNEVMARDNFMDCLEIERKLPQQMKAFKWCKEWLFSRSNREVKSKQNTQRKNMYCKNSLTGGESRLMSSEESEYSLLGLLTLAVVNACNEITKTTISPDRAIGSIRPFKENSKCILMTCEISSFCS